jgi:hypothetical protein
MSYHLELADGSIGKSNDVHIQRDDLPRINSARFYPAGLVHSMFCHGTPLYAL